MNSKQILVEINNKIIFLSYRTPETQDHLSHLEELKILKDKYLAAVEEEKLSIIEEGDLVFVKAKSGAYSAIVRAKEVWTGSIMGHGFYIRNALSSCTKGEYSNMSFSFENNEFKKITL
jgi:hypothetical protein